VSQLVLIGLNVVYLDPISLSLTPPDVSQLVLIRLDTPGGVSERLIGSRYTTFSLINTSCDTPGGVSERLIGSRYTTFSLINTRCDTPGGVIE
jgi:hypothetical protein